MSDWRDNCKLGRVYLEPDPVWFRYFRVACLGLICVFLALALYWNAQTMQTLQQMRYTIATAQASGRLR